MSIFFMCMDTLRQVTDSSESKGVTLGFLQIGPSSVYLGFVFDLVVNNQAISIKMVMSKMLHCVSFGFDLDYIMLFEWFF